MELIELLNPGKRYRVALTVKIVANSSGFPGPGSTYNYDWDGMQQWCKERFGEGGQNKRCKWDYRWPPGGNQRYFDFKDKDNALMFMLRWS